MSNFEPNQPEPQKTQGEPVKKPEIMKTRNHESKTTPLEIQDKPEEKKVVASKESKKKDKVKVRCPDCPFKPGLTDPNTICPTCNGSGQVLADPLE